MKIEMSYQTHITPKALSEALAESSPKEFAAFWFEFEKMVTDDRLREFALAMSPVIGSNRKKPLRKLISYMDYYHIKKEVINE